MKHCIWAAALLALQILLVPASYGAYDPSTIPPPLEPWVPWVQAEEPQTACPLSHYDEHQCFWPSHLALEVDDNSGSFTLSATVFREYDLPLPGNDKHWPLEVTDQTGTALKVISYEGQPRVILPAGRHTIKGRFRWPELPQTLALPVETGILKLTRNSQPINDIQMDGSAIRLHESSGTTEEAEQEALQLRVYRLLHDGIPMKLKTLLQLEVSGNPRELELATVLPPSFRASALESELPARIDANNTLSILLKPGSWYIELEAYSLTPTATASANSQEAHWPAQEIWSFVADLQYRNIEILDAPAIDPNQSQVPQSWRGFPAYLITTDTPAKINELNRISGERSNKLTLDKKLWLDFSGSGFTVEDNINGQLGPNSRLNVTPQHELGSAVTPQGPLLVSVLDDNLGVEVRQQFVNLNTMGRMQQGSKLPVSGWQHDFESVSSQLFLPPGWTILAAMGPDQASGVWLDRFNLWDIFLILIITVSIKRVAGWRTALVALAVVTLTYQREGAPLIIWLNLAICIALVGYINDKWKQRLGYYTLASFAIFVVIMLPYGLDQARMMAYPQLEHNRVTTHSGDTTADAESLDQSMPVIASAAPSMHSEELMLEEIVATGARSEARPQISRPQQQVHRSKKTNIELDYNPQQQLQAGPPRMSWRWNSAHLHWAGPVSSKQTLTLIMVPPLLDRLGHLLALLSPLLLAWLLWLKSPRPDTSKISVALKPTGAATLMLLAMMSWSPEPQAAVVIDSDLLYELRERLFEPALCHPECATIESTHIQTDGSSLTLTAKINVFDATTMAIPALGNQWPAQVLLNKNAAALMRNENELWIALPAGNHTLNMKGNVQLGQTLDLSFSHTVHNLTVELDNWQLSNSENPSRHIQLDPVIDTSVQQPDLIPNDIAPLLKVERHIHLGIDWTVQTTITRIAPEQGGISTFIPLLAGEMPLSEKQLVNNAMPVQLAPNERYQQWRSRLEPSAELRLNAPTEANAWYETWTLTAAPLWHIEAASDSTMIMNNNRVSWLPRPQDQLTLAVSRPEPADGATLVINALSVQHNMGPGIQNTNLDIGIQTLQGGNFNFQLPEGAELSRLYVNGIEKPNTQKRGNISIPVNSDTQSLGMEWQVPSELSLLTQPTPLQLNYPYANTHVTVHLPRDRWVLWLSGPHIGPAIVLWSVLAVVLILAIGISRTKITPLKSYEWVLLSLGVVTMNALILLVVAAWFMGLSLRGRTQARHLGQFFNLAQFALIMLSVIAIGLMLVTIPYGLLAQPEMLIQGNGSSSHALKWFTDQGAEFTPEVTIISLPIWSYRLAMLLWSLWLAFALTGWIRWGWTQLCFDQFWLSKTNASSNNSDNTEKE